MPEGLPDEAIYRRIAALPPGVLLPSYRGRLEDAFAHWFDPRAPLPEWRKNVLLRLLGVGEPHLAGCPDLHDVGMQLLAPDNDVEVRRIACMLLEHYPSVESARALVALLFSEQRPDLRGQAAWTLGFRQAQQRHPSLHVAPDVMAIADEALREAFLRGHDTLPHFRDACRHVADPVFHDAIAEHPERAAELVDAFATPALARALLARIDALPEERVPRLIRLIGATLGQEAVDPLLAYAGRANVAEKVEALFTAYAIDRSRAAPAVDAFVAGLAFPGDVNARRAFHDAHPGRHPVVDALRVVRTTATIPPGERPARCREAFEAMRAAHAGHALVGPELLPFYAYVAFGARSLVPDALADAVAAYPPIVELREELVLPYLRALAARGRMKKLAEEGARLGAPDEAAFLLAQRGRPFLALRTRLTTRRESVAALAAEVLGLALCGRPDLAMRSLAAVTPEADPIFGSWVHEPFPGPDERFALERGTDARLGAVARKDFAALLALAEPSPAGADPDAVDFSLVAAFEGPRGSDLTGARVLLVGRFPDRDALRARIVALGALVVDAPFAGTDRFVVGDEPDRDVLHRLWQLGARPVPPSLLT